MQNYYIEDNKVTFLISVTYGQYLDIKQITLDLDKDNEKPKIETYKIKAEDYTVSDSEFYTYSIDRFKILNDKIYLTVSAYDSREVSNYRNNASRDYIYVLDENSKDILYIGKIMGRNKGFIYPSIVREEEL